MSNNKQKAPRNAKQNVSFFGALLFGFGCCVLSWLALALVMALVLSTGENPIGPVPYLSPVTAGISLAVGGFVSAKLDVKNSTLSALIIGCVFLGICYAVTAFLNISQNYGAAVKTVIIVMMLLSPLLGAKIASGRGEKRKRRRKL